MKSSFVKRSFIRSLAKSSAVFSALVMTWMSGKSMAIATPVAAASSAAQTSRVCVLNFERPEHGVTEILRMIFANAEETEVRNLAVPTDFLECIEGGSEEIVVIAHALIPNDEQNSTLPVDLGYFRRAERTARSETTLRSPSYVVKPFLPQIMRRVRETMKSQSLAGTLRLKKIRWMSCLPQRVFERYSDLTMAIAENRIQVDFAPKNELMSWVHGQELTSPDFDWLAKSIDCQRLRVWRTEHNNNCREDWWYGCNRATARFCLPK